VNGSSITSLMIGLKRLLKLLVIRMEKTIHRLFPTLTILFLNILESTLNKNLKDKSKIQVSVSLMDLVIVILMN